MPQSQLPHQHDAARKYAFYPGCTLHSTGVEFGASTKMVCDALGLELVEIDDWNCCGATEYFSQDELVACSVVARNLALVESGVDQLVAPCAACYLNLKKTDHLMIEDPKMNARILTPLGSSQSGSITGFWLAGAVNRALG